MAEAAKDFRDDVESEAGKVVVEDVEDTGEQVDAKDPFEGRARRMGWKPEDEYSGDKRRWVDAKTFVERGENELPILRERLRRMDTQFSSTTQRLTETERKLGEATGVLTELKEMAVKADQRGYNRALLELKEREVKAVKEADEAEYRRIQMEREQLEATKPAPVVTKPAVAVDQNFPQVNPTLVAWVQENPWFNSDKVLNSVAIAYDEEVRREFPYWSEEEKLAEVKARVVGKFPEKFGNTRRERPAAVAVSTVAAPLTKPKGKTARDLPPDAKAALERFKKMIPGYKDEDYLAVYDWE